MDNLREAKMKDSFNEIKFSFQSHQMRETVAKLLNTNIFTTEKSACEVKIFAVRLFIIVGHCISGGTIKECLCNIKH